MITPDTSDERLRDIEQEIKASIALGTGGSPGVTPGLLEYLEQLRDEQFSGD